MNKFRELSEKLMSMVAEKYDMPDNWNNRRLVDYINYKVALRFLLREFMFENECFKLVDIADIMREHHSSTIAGLDNADNWYYADTKFFEIVEHMRNDVYDILKDNIQLFKKL
jgi:hypothetical protein